MCYTWFDLLKFAYKKICFCLHLAGGSDETSMTKWKICRIWFQQAATFSKSTLRVTFYCHWQLFQFFGSIVFWFGVMMQLCKFFSISPSTAYMLNYLFLCFHRSTKLKSTSTELVDFFSTCLWTWLKILLQICILVSSISTTIWFKLFPQTSVSNWQLGFLKIIFTNKTSILENWATLLWNLYNYSFATCIYVDCSMNYLDFNI